MNYWEISYHDMYGEVLLERSKASTVYSTGWIPNNIKLEQHVTPYVADCDNESSYEKAKWWDQGLVLISSHASINPQSLDPFYYLRRLRERGMTESRKGSNQYYCHKVGI